MQFQISMHQYVNVSENIYLTFFGILKYSKIVINLMDWWHSHHKYRVMEVRMVPRGRGWQPEGKGGSLRIQDAAGGLEVEANGERRGQGVMRRPTAAAVANGSCGGWPVSFSLLPTHFYRKLILDKEKFLQSWERKIERIIFLQLRRKIEGHPKLLLPFKIKTVFHSPPPLLSIWLIHSILTWKCCV